MDKSEACRGGDPRSNMKEGESESPFPDPLPCYDTNFLQKPADLYQESMSALMPFCFQGFHPFGILLKVQLP